MGRWVALGWANPGSMLKAFQSLFESLDVRRHLFAGLARDQEDEQLPEAVSGDVDRDGPP
jgi:hypothetical protein